MAKVKSVFVCQNCGAEAPKWVGKCPACGEWNSYVEEIVRKEGGSVKSASFVAESTKSKPILIREVEISEEPRMDTGCGEFNRVLGGGIVPGSLTLIGGDPGIGKSTLVLPMLSSCHQSFPASGSFQMS